MTHFQLQHFPHQAGEPDTWDFDAEDPHAAHCEAVRVIKAAVAAAMASDRDAFVLVDDQAFAVARWGLH